jgi:hypothetical protein
MIQTGNCADIERLLEEEIEMYVRLLKELIERTVETSLLGSLMDGLANLLGGDPQKLWLKYVNRVSGIVQSRS